MGYWDNTAQIIAANGGKNPSCPSCGKEMYAEDDHGRFACSCGGHIGENVFDSLFTGGLPQVPAGVELSEADKERIPAFNRLHHPPSSAEAAAFREIHERFRRDEEEEERLRDGATVHILYQGFPLCGFSQEVPAKWPKGHLLVRLEDTDEANCPGCVARKDSVKA